MDHFEIVKVIGRGSFGKVYLVRKKDDGKVFAMKTLKKDMILRKN
jgi:serine/threonine protein kinase